MELNRENYTYFKNQKLTRAQIAAQFNIEEWRLKKLIAKNGWGTPRPIIENESFFTDYSESSCYWAGFIAADGCITVDNTLKICLKYDDIDHLYKLKDDLKFTHTISSNTDKYYRCEVSLRSVILTDDLRVNYNIVPNKSLTYLMPNLPDKYFPHFLRGYFDGDGSINPYYNKQGEPSSVETSITGSIPAMDYVKNRLAFIDFRVNSKGSVNSLCCSTDSSLKLLDYMYKDASVYLNRKYAVYKLISDYHSR